MTEHHYSKTTSAIVGLFDYFIIPVFIILFLYEPNFLNGYVFSFDEGQHLAWIDGILRGKIPYRDMYMIYGPFLEYLPALLMKVFGISLAILRIFYHFGTMISLVMGYFLCRYLLKTRFFAYLAAWLLITITVMPMWSSRWGGIRIGSGFLVILLFLEYAKNGKRSLLYLSGLATAFSFLISQEIGFCAGLSVFVSLFGFNYYKKFSIQNFVKSIFVYLAGAATLLVPVFIYSLFTGALVPYVRAMFYDVPFKFPVIYRDDYPFLPFPDRPSFAMWLTYLTSRTFYLYASVSIYCVGILYLLRRIFRKMWSLDSVYALAIISFGIPLLKSATRMLGGPQFNIALPPVIIMAAMLTEHTLFRGASDVTRHIAQPPTKIGRNDPCVCGSGRKYKNCCMGKRAKTGVPDAVRKVSLSAFIIALIILYVFIATRPDMRLALMAKKFAFAKTMRLKLKPLEFERAKGILVPPPQAEVFNNVVHYLGAKLGKNEPIFTLPHEGHYYFFLDKPGSTRFDSALFAEVDPAYQEEVIKALDAVKPRYLIYVKDSYLVTDHNPVPNEDRIPVIVDYVKKRYVQEAQFGGTLILRRK